MSSTKAPLSGAGDRISTKKDQRKYGLIFLIFIAIASAIYFNLDEDDQQAGMEISKDTKTNYPQKPFDPPIKIVFTENPKKVLKTNIIDVDQPVISLLDQLEEHIKGKVDAEGPLGSTSPTDSPGSPGSPSSSVIREIETGILLKVDNTKNPVTSKPIMEDKIGITKIPVKPTEPKGTEKPKVTEKPKMTERPKMVEVPSLPPIVQPMQSRPIIHIPEPDYKPFKREKLNFIGSEEIKQVEIQMINRKSDLPKIQLVTEIEQPSSEIKVVEIVDEPIKSAKANTFKESKVEVEEPTQEVKVEITEPAKPFEKTAGDLELITSIKPIEAEEPDRGSLDDTSDEGRPEIVTPYDESGKDSQTLEVTTKPAVINESTGTRGSEGSFESKRNKKFNPFIPYRTTHCTESFHLTKRLTYKQLEHELKVVEKTWNPTSRN